SPGGLGRSGLRCLRQGRNAIPREDSSNRRYPDQERNGGSFDHLIGPAASGLPWWQVLLAEGLFASLGTPSFPWDLVHFGSGRTDSPGTGEVGSSPGFTGSPLESMPRASDSGDPGATSQVAVVRVLSSTKPTASTSRSYQMSA